MMKRIFLLALLHSAFAMQASNINGAVNNIEGHPIEFAVVTLLSDADSSLVKGAVTNASGEFILEQVPDGNYHIEVSMTG